METRTVKVTKSGNSRALPVPSDLARDAQIDVGDAMSVEVRGTDIIYRRNPAGALVVGEGRSKVAIAPRGRALLMPGRSSSGALDTWDF